MKTGEVRKSNTTNYNVLALLNKKLSLFKKFALNELPAPGGSLGFSKKRCLSFYSTPPLELL